MVPVTNDMVLLVTAVATQLPLRDDSPDPATVMQLPTMKKWLAPRVRVTVCVSLRAVAAVMA